MSDTIPPLTEKDGESKDLVAENIEKLKQLFPEIVTDGKVDFETLQEVLGEFKEESKERYSFTWNGKSKARKLAMTPSRGTLRPAPEESVNWDSTENLFIEGDNLEVLKLFQRSYHGKIKMIFIDPPYNTGNDFVYNDDFKDNLSNYLKLTGQKDIEGNRITSNPETSGRYHTDWLNMMFPRLTLARELLKEDGVIFISISDDEYANLKKICDEIYGEENYLGTIVWKKKTNGNNMGHIPPVHDYFIGYSRNASESSLLGFPLSKDYLESKYSNPDNDPRGDWTTSDLSANHKGPHFPIKNPKTEEVHYPPEGRYWVFNEKDVSKLIDNGRIIFGKSGDGKPVQKKFLSERNSIRKKPESWWGNHGMNQDGTEELGKLIGKKLFDHPKPSKTIKHLINISTHKDDIILDFFAGSGSTAHAVLDLNKDDNDNRKFMMVQLPEPYEESTKAYKLGFKNVADLSKERIRKVINKISTENSAYDGDLGFKVFKLDKSNLKPWDPSFQEVQLSIENSIENIKPDRSEQDVLYEILLKYGLDLSLHIEEQEIAGSKVFVAGAGALFICLAPNIDLDVVEGIAKQKEELNPELTRVVFRDSGFKNDVVKTNAVQILKQHGIEDVRSI